MYRLISCSEQFTRWYFSNLNKQCASQISVTLHWLLIQVTVLHAQYDMRVSNHTMCYRYHTEGSSLLQSIAVKEK
jgi:hypothetical protein